MTLVVIGKGGANMRTVNITIEDMGRQWYGHAWGISSEYHDAYVYTADSKKEAIRKYEEDRRVKVGKVTVW